MDQIEKIIREHLLPSSDILVQLGLFDFRLVSNVNDFSGQKYFSARSRRAYSAEKTDFELWCIATSKCKLDINSIIPFLDNSYRSKSFRNGYYVTDHFGSPLYLLTRENRYYVFGEELERIVWPYFIKHFLMLHTLRNDSLHLKAAACSINSQSTLLFGRGGAGKTVFLTELCRNGAQFITNSHSIIKEGRVYGVPSSIRVRSDFDKTYLADIKKDPALHPGELIIDPYDIFSVDKDNPPVANICVLNYNKEGKNIIETLPEQEAYDYAEQMSLAVNVYRLEEDLLDYCAGDCYQFSTAYNQMKTNLRNLIHNNNCYYISCDILDSNSRNSILTLLS